jgi:hypothetical protein
VAATNTTMNNPNQQAAGQASGRRRSRMIGAMGTGARLLVGLVLLGSVLQGELAGPFRRAAWLLGLVGFPAVLLGWQGWRARRGRPRLRATGPLGHGLDRRRRLEQARTGSARAAMPGPAPPRATSVHRRGGHRPPASTSGLRSSLSHSRGVLRVQVLGAERSRDRGDVVEDRPRRGGELLGLGRVGRDRHGRPPPWTSALGSRRNLLRLRHRAGISGR